MTRLLVYDDTAGALSRAWRAGDVLYRALGRFDATHAVGSWHQALTWLAEQGRHRRISEIQFWGHGKWGCALVGAEPLDVQSLAPAHAHRPLIDAVRRRLAPDALWWFRTCETVGAQAGHDFARTFAEHLGCRIAGHTFVIAAWQSGLHSLAPGATPDWPQTEGLLEGSPTSPLRAHNSARGLPHTVHCLQGRIPAGY